MFWQECIQYCTHSHSGSCTHSVRHTFMQPSDPFCGTVILGPEVVGGAHRRRFASLPFQWINALPPRAHRKRTEPSPGKGRSQHVRPSWLLTWRSSASRKMCQNLKCDVICKKENLANSACGGTFGKHLLEYSYEAYPSIPRLLFNNTSKFPIKCSTFQQ